MLSNPSSAKDEIVEEMINPYTRGLNSREEVNLSEISRAGRHNEEGGMQLTSQG